MSQCFAVLVDGGFLKYKLSSKAKPATADDFREFLKKLAAQPALVGMRLHRIYFYDATPFEGAMDTPLGGPKVEFGSSDTATRNKSLHAELSRDPFMALRLGELSMNGWQLRPKVLRKATGPVTIAHTDLQPTIKQKGVDMRIGMDIAALTLKKHVQVIVLVTGDSDFIPAMKFARREGCHLYLVPQGHSIKAQMREHSDLVLDPF